MPFDSEGAKGISMKKTIFVTLVAGLLVVLTGASPISFSRKRFSLSSAKLLRG